MPTAASGPQAAMVGSASDIIARPVAASRMPTPASATAAPKATMPTEPAVRAGPSAAAPSASPAMTATMAAMPIAV